MKKNHWLALLIILAFGEARLNFEQRLTEERRATFYHGAKPDLPLSQKLTQAGFLAALSGFRALVADFFWIEGHIAWEHTEWGSMRLFFQTAVTLQPRNVIFWDIFAWHMGYNASLAARNDINQPNEALRIKNQRQYFKAAENIYLEGIQNNPDTYYLYEKLAEFYRDKLNDNLKASEYFDKAAQFPNSPTYEKRFAAYYLSSVPGREQEAYDKLVKLYNMGYRERLPELLLRLKYLEDKLNIPPAQRIQLTPSELQELKILENRVNNRPTERNHNPDKK